MADTASEALAGMAKMGKPRVPMGRAGTAFTSPSAKPASGTLVKKKNAAAADPAAQGQGTRVNVPSKKERLGAAHSIKVNMVKNTDPAAAATQANGRVIPAVTKRTADGFGQGMKTSY
jgi:hypothetical protein